LRARRYPDNDLSTQRLTSVNPHHPAQPPMRWVTRMLLCMTVVMFFSLAALAGVEYASHHPNSVVIMLSTDKINYKLRAEIHVTIKIKNISSIPLGTYINDNTTDYDLFVKNGSTVMQSSGFRNSPGGKVVSLRGSELRPGSEVVVPGTHGKSSLISDWGIKITEPGTYIITAVSRETKRKSNPVTITVTQ